MLPHFQAFFNLGGQGAGNSLKRELRPESLGWDGGRDRNVSCAMRILPLPPPAQGEARACPGQRSPCALHTGLKRLLPPWPPAQPCKDTGEQPGQSQAPAAPWAGHPARWRRPRNTLPFRSAPHISMFTHVIRLDAVYTQLNHSPWFPVPRKVLRGLAVSELFRAACPWPLSSPRLCAQPGKADGKLSLETLSSLASTRAVFTVSWQGPDEPPGAMLSGRFPARICGQNCHNHRLHSQGEGPLGGATGAGAGAAGKPTCSPSPGSSGTGLDHSQQDFRLLSPQHREHDSSTQPLCPLQQVKGCPCAWRQLPSSLSDSKLGPGV